MRIFYFDKGVKELPHITKIGRKPVWIDITNMNQQDADLLKKHFNLHPLTIEDLLAANSRIKIEEFSTYLFCVFYGMRKRSGIHTEEIDFVLGDNFLITNHKRESKVISDLQQDKERLGVLFTKGVSFIFHKIVDKEVDDFFPVLQSIDQELEVLEEEATAHPTHKIIAKIRKLKRRITAVKRVALPQREKISMLAKNDFRFVSKKLTPYFRDIYDHSIRVADAVENYREAVGSVFEVYMSSVSNNMNQVMKMLSIIATIALPLTVISGIYGTNFLVLPGAASPVGFWAMVSFMVLLCLGMLLYFRKKKWL